MLATLDRMHSGDLSEIDQASLSEQEKEALLQVMERAKVVCYGSITV